jgi:hypothetical protein
MPDLIAIGQGLNAVKALTDIAKTIVGLRDSAKLLETTVEFQQQLLSIQKALLDAQTEQATLIQTIRDLEEEVARFKTWETEKQRYELKDLGSGALARMIKSDAQGTEPFHAICANCYERGEKRYLQDTGDLSRMPYMVWGCLNCGSKIVIGQWPPAFAQDASPSPPA